MRVSSSLAALAAALAAAAALGGSGCSATTVDYDECAVNSECRDQFGFGFVCSAARSLKLDSMADVQALTFEQLLGKGDILLKATKDILALYGMDLDEWMESVTAETLSENGDSAVWELECTSSFNWSAVEAS